MTEPTTAAGRALLIEPPNSDEEARVAYLAIEAEARQQDGSALRLLKDALLALFDQPMEHRVELADRIRAALVALPPSAPPALDVERLARAMEAAWPGWLEEAPGTDEARAEMREYATTIAAEYARLQEQER